jgi:arylsulfatase A-like enzyme
METLRSDGSLLGRLAAVFCMVAGLAAGASAQSDAPRYNVVLIMADDLDVASVDKMLALGLMPHLRHDFVDEGVRFTNAFVTNSLCCPSRATLMTGQYSHNSRVLTNSPPAGGLGAFRASSTLPVWLSAAGYRTSHVGKFLNGYGRELPADYAPGGDKCAAPDGGPIAPPRYIPPGWQDWYGLLDTDLSTYRMYDVWVNDNCAIRFEARRADDPNDLRRDGYQTDLLAWRAVQFLDEANAAGAPFYLEVTPLAPHLEVIPGLIRGEPYPEIWKWNIRPAPRHAGSVAAWPPIAPALHEDLGDKPAWMQPGMRRERPPLTAEDYLYLTRQYRHRLESLRAVDDLIGAVVGTLRGNGQLASTVLVFTSDNGFLYGEHNMSEKLVAYEESIRVPLFVRMPDGRGPRTVDAPVLNNDLAPTIAELAGAAPGLTMDGTSFVPLLASDVPDWRKRFLVEHWDTGALMDMPGFAAVRVKSAPPASVSADLLYLEYRNPDVDGLWNTPEFYDLATDPYQCESLHASQDPLRVAQRQVLHGVLTALKACAGETCRQLEFCPGPFAFCPSAPSAAAGAATLASPVERVAVCARAAVR